LELACWCHGKVPLQRAAAGLLSKCCVHFGVGVLLPLQGLQRVVYVGARGGCEIFMAVGVTLTDGDCLHAVAKKTNAGCHHFFPSA